VNARLTISSTHSVILPLHGALALVSILIGVASHNGSLLSVRLLCGYFTITAVWLIGTQYYVKRTLFDPSGLFLLVVIAFHGGQVILELFGLNQQGFLGGRFDDRTLALTIVLSAASLTLFHAGVLIGDGSAATKSAVTMSRRCPVTRRVGWCLVVVSLVPLIVALSDASAIALSEGYGALYQRDAQTGAAASSGVLALLFAPGLCFAVAGGPDRRFGRTASAVAAVVLAAAGILLGFRATAVMPLIAFAWVWTRSVGPISRKALVTCVLICVVLFPLVRITRLVSLQDRAVLLQPSAVIEHVGNPAIDLLHEIGGTLAVVAYVVELVPAERPFSHGGDVLRLVTAAVPNLWWEVHTSAEGSHGRWLVGRVNPWLEKQGWGLGFSIVAEAYMTGGIVGGPLMMLLLGAGFGRLIRWGTTGDPARVAALGGFLGFWLFVARAELSTMVRPLVWYALLPWAAVIAIRHARGVLVRRRSGRSRFVNAEAARV
jgi:hypothetical protein